MLHPALLVFAIITFTSCNFVFGLTAEACRQGASDADHNNQMLSRLFIGYGKMVDHIVYLPKLCLVSTLSPPHQEWSMGGDGPSILGPSVYKSSMYRDIRCPSDKLNYDVIHQYAEELARNRLLPVECKDERYNEDIGIGIVLIATGYPTEAYTHYNKMAERDVTCPAIYYGRALAYVKSGLSQHENAKHALNDYNTALKYTSSEVKALAILERRAEVYTAMRRHTDAYNDYTRILKLNQSDPNIFLYRGSVLFLMEQYNKATDDFKVSLQQNPDQPVAMHYQALCLYHMGRLREAIKVFWAILEIKPEYTEVLQSLGQAYRELGDFDSALVHFDKALALNPTDARSLEYKGHLQYYHGDTMDALQSFRTCASLEPYNEGCQFMKGASYATTGQYYPAIKEFTKVMLNYPLDPTRPSTEYTRVPYLREWARYMHSNLESSLADMCAETNLSAEFREYWVNSYPFNIQNYTEQPGIQPHISDVEVPSWKSFAVKMQQLLCRARHIGMQVQYNEADGHLINQRITTTMGLAALEISQKASWFFKSPKVYRAKHGKKMSWRDAFDIAVKWRRLVDANQPVMWLDQLPVSKNNPSTFNHHISLIRGDRYNILYLGYLRQVVDLMKQLVMDFTNAMSTADYKSELERASDYVSLMKTMMKYGGAQLGEPGFMLGTKVPSVKDRNRKHLDGFMVSLGSLEQNNYTVLSIDIATKRARTQQYHAELDFVWEKIIDDMKKIGSSEESAALQDSLVNSVLTLIYYFYNLMPLSKGSGVVSYATALGLLLAVGKEVTGRMPAGKILEMDALLATTPEDFVADVKSWLHLKKYSSSTKTGLPIVSEVFPTLRSCLETLNLNFSDKCK